MIVVISRDLDHAVLAAAKRSDPELQTAMASKEKPGNWKKFPLKRYHQICMVKTPAMQEEKLFIVAPTSLQKQFLKDAHDNVSHQGSDRTMAQLSEASQWPCNVTSAHCA